jgi:hypothetical protein
MAPSPSPLTGQQVVRGGKGVGKEPDHTKAIKPGLPQIIQNSPNDSKKSWYSSLALQYGRYIIISLDHIASILLARVDVSVFPVLAGN